MKHLNQEERKTVCVNLIANDKKIEYYKNLWCDPNDSQEATEDTWEDIGVINNVWVIRKVIYIYEQDQVYQIEGS